MNKIKHLLKSNILICILLFTFAFGVYISNLRYIGVTDTLTNERFAYNFAKTGHLYLDEKVEFTNLLAEDDYPLQISNTHEVNGRFYSKYPPVLSILSYPFFKTAQIVGISNTNLIGKITGSFITSLSVVILYLGLIKLTKRKVALLISIIYAFGSSTWGVSSQAVWQHTFSQLFSVIILYILFDLIKNSEVKNRRFEFLPYLSIGLLLGINITVRPTNVIAAIIIGVFILFTKKTRSILWTIIGGAIPLGLMVLYNYKAFGSLLSSGYGSESSSGWSAPFIEGFLGLVISPSVGLLIFSPIFVVAFIGAFKILVKGFSNFKLEFSKQNIFVAFILIFLSNWIVYSKWWAWHGDSWVYRMLMDSIPYLVVGFIYPLEKVFQYKKSVKQKLLLGLTAILLLFSMYTQFLGAFSYDYSWDSRYKVSWKDYSYLFNIKNSRLAYYLKNQKYYLSIPHKSVYVLSDDFGDNISFENGKTNINGNKKIVHAAFLSSGRIPSIKDNRLEINTKYDGISFYISNNFLNQEIKINISMDTENLDNESMFQIREIGGANDGRITKFKVSKEVSFTIKGSQEVRIQNDEFSDKVSIKNLSFVVKE